MNKVLVMVFISISVLISGVVLLSLKSSAKSATDPYTISTRATPSMRLNPRSRVVSKADGENDTDHNESDQAGSPNRPKRDEVMWEVGSVSDDEDESRVEGGGAEETKQGLGEGSGRGQGERRGLLDDEDEGEVEEGGGENQSEKGRRARRNEDDEEEGFGEYEAVAPRRSDEGPSGN